MRFISVTGAETGGRCLVNLDHVLTITEVDRLTRDDNPGRIAPQCMTIIGLDASKTANDSVHVRQTIDEVLAEVDFVPARNPERFGD